MACSRVRFTFTFTIYIFRLNSSGLLRCVVQQLPTVRSMAVHLALFDPAVHEANMTLQNGWNYLTRQDNVTSRKICICSTAVSRTLHHASFRLHILVTRF